MDCQRTLRHLWRYTAWSDISSLRCFRGNVACVPCALFLTAQHPHAELIVHALAAPAGGGRVAVDVDALSGVRLPQRAPFINRCRLAILDLELSSIGSQEPPTTTACAGL